MGNKNKGISLVSLIIIVVSIIILIGIVVNVGYNYIEESNRTEETAVIKLVSDAASNRQNYIHVDANTYYVGYPLKVENVSNISGLPEDFSVKSEDLWYFIDAKSAEELGVRESDKYIEKDLKNPESETVKTILVDYVTGNAYIVEVRSEFLDATINDIQCNESPDGGTHAYSVQTCTKGSRCIYCGAPQAGHENGLGHDFLAATCTSAGICSRCGVINSNAPAKGHSFSKDPVTGEEVWTTDATKHWKYCTVCGLKKETEDHTKGYARIFISGSTTVYDEKYHKEICSVCGWESVKTLHKIVYEVTGEHSHKRYCDLCEYYSDHNDSGWIATDPLYHWRECQEDCKSSDGTIDCIEGNKVFYEKHIDENNDDVCDLCARELDNLAPSSFETPGSYARVDVATTSTLQISAYTKDNGKNGGVKGYYFGINYNDGKGTVWSELVEVANDEPASKLYTNLIHNTLYDIYVKAVDYTGNETDVYKIPNTVTAKVPNVSGILGVPTGYVSKPITIQFKKLNTSLPNLSIEYSTDGGATWVDESVNLIIEKETVDILARVKDTRSPEPNKGDIWGPEKVTSIDLTPPEVTISPKEGDTPSIMQTSHKAVVTLNDKKVGIAAGTKIEYAWSLSNTSKPTTFLTTTTSNKEVTNTVTVEITTPSGGIGQYFLWINSGVEDALGNKTKEAVCSIDKYNIDDQDLRVTDIRMYNSNPSVEAKTNYVKTNGIVTVTFATSKALKGAPTVKIGGVTVTDITSSDNINWVAKVVATQEMPEGRLTLSISNIITSAGKLSAKTYNENDLIEGPVIYDRTLPTMENVEK